ncbi:uncharacterized protein LOC110944942 [Helianthus annuus]|uniref:uncharacterized protein LOC110944942 n=1 Tax=Helianthus annuus TaxID=4232 RepID=UPI000B8F0541|nr:uncharacterized protein LOC110944942 [Helianthus annuus]
MGILPKCDNYLRHHIGQCRYRKCETCGKIGHLKETCWYGAGHGKEGQDGSGNREGNNNNNNYQGGSGTDQELGQDCFNRGSIGHPRKEYPRDNQASGKVYLGTKPRCD